METCPRLILTLLLAFLALSLSPSTAYPQLDHNDFLACLSVRLQNQTSIANVAYTPNNSSYSSILQSSIRNLRFTSPSTPKPLVIVTPVDESQIQEVIHCSRQHGLQIRTRSGGHDYEGLSYTSRFDSPFVILDLINLSEITIDVGQESAWVQTGATLGQLYYRISQASRTLAFPAGGGATVGVGGHISGGGYGSLLRKYGLAADNVVDARLIDVNGRILDRSSMGEELFWAIRGGGGASFGVVTAWKIRLVPVPETLTFFSVNRTLEQNATKLVHKWQYVAPNLPEDILIALIIRKVNAGERKTVQVTFISLFLGRVDALLPLLEERFPELGVRREECREVSWVQSTLLFANYQPEDSPEILTSRVTRSNSSYFKAKSDYVQDPIPEHGLEGLWKLFDEEEADMAELNVAPYGGRMQEISESATPFPHRAGNLYKFLHLVYWDEAGKEASERHINWMRKLYAYLTPYVSKFPRAAYVNYRDLDLGVNKEGNTSYAQASRWGFRYFKNNFNRLVRVKTMVDPGNFFRNEQSIPPLFSWGKKN
ncbi:Berberine bridge enzyme-like 28 [Sesamum angolense]|uniref:Berberine bridge enzyme-like 28 n=1 Tax=Sesamum angolense TaxID=2727404 RepID=A0AAE2BZJ4_9LAMI|nr:Berberine bridge enzyme-like 28 [Sesamum angolense]